ncbi:hypothetical protein AS188_04165 [Kocuria flava]|uniref:Uracil permease n=1 Tax=Kocuria flava TaxID=446860 RepID=A0A0U3HVY4_9MICC|nr:hypothetical protein AS188_04165 [Kocuria flava]GEO90745.1 hypothetical protein KFL01_00510 [Kocuria flava]
MRSSDDACAEGGTFHVIDPLCVPHPRPRGPPRADGTAAAHPRPEDEKLPLGRTTAYGFQHVLTMYGAIVAVPLIIGQAGGLSADETALLISSCLLMGGIATFLQSFGAPYIGSKLPLVQGVSFAGVAPMLVILAGGSDLRAVFGAVLVSSVVGFLFAGAFSRIIRFFPPVVTGTVITVIGISLLPVAISWAAGGGEGGAAAPDSLLLAGITLLIVLLLSKVGIGMISRLSILPSFVLGTGVAVLMGTADSSGVGEGALITFPTPLAFGTPTFEVAAIVSMLIVVLVTMTETTADILAVGEITGAKVDSRRVANGLRADMLSSAGAPLLNSFTQTAFALGLVPVAAPQFYAGFPAWTQTILGSGISAAAIVAIVLNLLFNELTAGNAKNPSAVAAAPVRIVRADVLAHLRDGDQLQNGTVVDREGAEVAVVPEHHFDDVRRMIDAGEITDTGQVQQLILSKSSS